ncbi:RagB/SusD family nutrient uptake outer membrane protein [Pedobacter sp. HX-22-1]|uniref:RagB/SusD family nutrient uptake outer membrane protein n=2 Tax=Pedobacter puniceum TaxID=2666136 RepID=A0A7K0FT85_9SPHI|nr:RagB/SusD family nutrient uptake outer membrane protein [Pedobacter puniceum]
MNINKFFTAIGLSSVLVFSSCDKVIEVEPEFSKDGSQIFTNLEDYQFALTGAYALLRQTGYYGNGPQVTGAFSVLPDMMSEHVAETNNELGNYVTQTDWTYAADDTDIATTWLAAYSVITQANSVIRNIDNFASVNQDEVNKIKGQALAIRGMVHFDLLRYWGEDYSRNSTAKGVPYRTVIDLEERPARLDVKTTYDNIFRDLLEAETLLGTKVVNTSTSAVNARAYIDRLVVRAMLARVYLYAKDYANAESYATLVINERPLASKTNFPNIWKDASAAEVIWAVAFNPGEGNPVSGIYTASSNNLGYRPTSNILALYDQANDIRFPAYFASRATGASAPILPFASNARKITNKHVGRGTATDNVVNWKAFRTGEMYLIRAEARALKATPDFVGALADLNTLREARINNYTPLIATGSALINAIAEERQRELYAEGHRWFDLKRTTKTITRSDCGTATSCSLAPTSRSWTWPIPQGELLANPNIPQAQQTTGY